MISDATGETLITDRQGGRACNTRKCGAIEHLHPLVRSRQQLERVLKEVEAAPGIVLYTLVNRELAEELESRCRG